MTRFQITNFNEVKEQLEISATELFNILLNQCLPLLNSFVKEQFLSYFADSDVWRGLIGDFAGDPDMDLQAQLGVPLDIVYDAYEEIGTVIELSLEVSKPIINTSDKSISFNLDFPNINEYISNIPSNAYISNKSGENIPWISWLLFGGNVEGYSIKYIGYGESGRLDKSIQLYSRTGRALMINDGGSWSTQDFLGFDEAQGIVSYILQDDKFVEGIENFMENCLRNG